MKKILLLALTAILILSICSCSSSSKSEEDPLTSKQIVQFLKEDYSLPITQELTYTEDTDVNDLLGRPNQYTSKTNWNDERDSDSVELTTGTDEDGDYRACTVEVFENSKDALDRKEYIESTWDIGGILSQDQYIYLIDNVLLRIPYELTTEEASEYEKAFTEIMSK